MTALLLPAPDPLASIEAELRLLGALILEPELVAKVVQILPDSRAFTDDRHAIIYRAILALAGEGTGLDLVTINRHLQQTGQIDRAGGFVYIAQLEMHVDFTGNAPLHAEMIRDCHRRRVIVDASNRMIAQAQEGTTPPREIVSDIGAELLAAVDDRDSGRFATMPELMELGVESAQAATDRRRRGEVLGVPFGLRDLDRLTGGLQPGEETILAARPSLGKTSLGIHVWRHTMKRGLPAVLFSLEMGEEPVANRVIAAEAGLDADRVRKGFASDAELQRYRAAADRLSSLTGLVKDCGTLSAAELHMQAKLLLARFPDLALIIVDGLWLMEHPARRGLNYAAQVGETSRGIKRLAKECGLPVLLLHQLNRGNEHRASSKDRKRGSGDRPGLADLRDSGAVEQDADVVIFLHRERRETTVDTMQSDDPSGLDDGDDLDDWREAYAKPTMEQDQDCNVPVEIIVAKNRNGPIGTARALFQTSSQRWLDLA